MKLETIFKDVECVIEGNPDIDITYVTRDSRDCGQDSLYVAIRGTKLDGHDFIDEAIANGATAVLVETMPKDKKEGVVYVVTQSVQDILHIVARNFFEDPAADMKIVGVTGTNGKTTTVTLLYQLFRELGYKVGLVSGVKVAADGEEQDGEQTTPGVLKLYQYFAWMKARGCEYVFMEVSSHGIDQNRIAGIDFTGAIFTNITHEHLDYHGTFENYLEVKKAFFDGLHPHAFALVNADDDNGDFMLQHTQAAKHTYGFDAHADFTIDVVANTIEGLQMAFNDGEAIQTKMRGTYNAYNMSAVFGAALLLQQDERDVLQALTHVTGARGRFEYHKVADKQFIVDYAHTPDALENLLQAVRNVIPLEAKMIGIVGCGGDRDTAKRPMMARLAQEYCDIAVFTSDNPRTENPADIWEDMRTGLENPDDDSAYMVELDRKKAIAKALETAGPGDVVVIAGKGHETYQEVNGEKLPFDDVAIATQIAQSL